MPNSLNYTTDVSTSIPTTFSTPLLILYIAIFVFSIIVLWKLFEKAGKPGWASIIPIYNTVVLFQISGMSPWLILLLLVPIANIIVSIMLCVNLAKSFGKGGGFAVGLIFLSIIFMAILAFGDAQHQGEVA